MNTERIAFIICVNDEKSYEECVFYINRLWVPDGYEVEIFAIREAESIYRAYNYAMQQSDAKYKIYMHQDVLLIKQNILLQLVDMFKKNQKIGMIGLLGGTNLPENRRFYRSWDAGNVLGCNDKKAFWNALGEDATRVWAVDGMFMMTQYDIPWREDVLDGWDFYDFSQSIEFAENGYEVWVPKQQEPWSIHDCGFLTLNAYDERQCKFLNVYQGKLPDYAKEPEVYPAEYRDRYALMMELKEQMKQLLFLGREDDVRTTLEQIWDERFVDTEFVILKNILEILQAERQAGEKELFLDKVASFEEAYARYRSIKYWLWRQKYIGGSLQLGGLMEVPKSAIEVISEHSILQTK